MCDNLERFVQFQGAPHELLNTLKEQKVFANHQVATETIAEMELLFGYLDATGVIDSVRFDFSLARGLDYYTGLIYEAILTGGGNVGSISGGGRYDELVGMFSSKSVPCIGVSIGIERVFAILEEKERKLNQTRATETMVLVAQIGKNLTEERLRICAELWKAGIKAETLYVDNPKVPKQLEYALGNGIPLVMWIGETELEQGIVKVKSLSYHEEYDVSRTDRFIDRVQELIDQNPVLLSVEEQEANKKKKADEKPGDKKESSSAAGNKAWDQLEKQLNGKQWLGGQQPSKQDADEFNKNFKDANVQVSAQAYPNVYAWYNLVSKFNEKIRSSWK